MSDVGPLRRSEEVRAVIARHWSAFRRGDVEVYLARYTWSPGLQLFGTDESEDVENRAEFESYIRTQFEVIDHTVSFADPRIDAWVDGNVGWSVLRSTVDSGAGPRALRMTTVLLLQQDEWRIVQEHWSVGMSNEVVFGVEMSFSVERVAEAVEAERPDLSGLAATDGTITLVFTDIEGSTALNGTYGDQGWIDVLKAHNEVVERLTEAHSGTVVQRVGDGYMLVFPAARRALRAALAIDAEIRERFNDPGSPIRVRIGIHTGEVIRHANEFFGQAVNYAARVAAAGAGGEILASNLVRELVATDRAYAFGPPREVVMKGIDGVQLVWPLERPAVS